MTALVAHHRSSSSQNLPSKRRQSAGIRVAPVTRREASTKTHKTARDRRKSADCSSCEDELDNMATTFLQFCPTCEKQIVTTSSKILYCSESCRQQDSKHNSSTSTSSKHTPPTFQVTAPRDIVPQLSPTATTRSPFFQPPASCLDSDSESTDSNGEKHPSAFRTNSEAARFLRQFQVGAERPPSRTRHNRSSANPPSLTHSLTSSASASVPYTPFSEPDRPSPFRRSPGHSRGSRSVDVATPGGRGVPTGPVSLETITKRTHDMKIQADAPEYTTLKSRNDHDASAYEKMTVSGKGASPGQSSLKRLLESTGGPTTAPRRGA